MRTRFGYLPGRPVFVWWWFEDCPLHFFQFDSFSRGHTKNDTKRSANNFSSQRRLLRFALWFCAVKVRLCSLSSLRIIKPREQIIIERCVLKWNTCTPADEGRTKAAKKHVLSFCFLFASAALETFCFFFFEEKLNALVFFSLSCLSCVFFKKVAENRSVFWAVFFTPEKANERFLPQNHSQTTSSLYLFINSFTHNKTYYKTTHIKIHHSERRRANANASVCCCFISLA